MTYKQYYRMAYEEALVDIMMELNVTQGYALKVLGRLITDNPNYIDDRMQFLVKGVAK